MSPVLLFVALSIWVFAITAAPNGTILSNKYVSKTVMLLLLVYTTIKIGFYFYPFANDMIVYVNKLPNYSTLNLFEALREATSEPLFAAFQWSISKISLSSVFFKMSVWLLFLFIFMRGFRKIFLPNQVLTILFAYMSYFIFFGYITNTVRQGIAIALLVYAFCCLISDSVSRKFYISLVSAAMFHITALPVGLILFFMQKKGIKLKTALTIWVVSALLFVTNLNQVVIGRVFQNQYLLKYTSDSLVSSYGASGNRIDFFLFSVIILITGYAVLKLFAPDKPLYKQLLSFYLLSNTYYLLFGYIAFSDRIAAYSWFLLPLLVFYGINNSEKKRNVLSFIALAVFFIVGYLSGSMNVLLT